MRVQSQEAKKVDRYSCVYSLFDKSFCTDYVPTVFRWEHGGRNVYITGTFNNWDKQVWDR